MPATLKHLGREATTSRDLYVLEAAGADDIPAAVDLAGSPFVCLLAWDAEAAPLEAIESVARRLLGAGCVYICCWGTGCSSVHDVFDLVSSERGPDAPVITSTWHEREPLEDAIWFALFSAHPDEAFAERCGAVLGASIGSASYASALTEAMADPRDFNAMLIERS